MTVHARVDDDGIVLDRSPGDAVDVEFDGRRIWSFAPTPRPGGKVVVAWPKALSRRLNGQAEVRLLAGDEELFCAPVSFGDGQGEISMLDRHGTPIIIDKWGLIQRPFDTRREAGVVEAITEVAAQILEVMRERCGIEGWIAFGTLLGAARDGRVIGHDSDIDLCYLSEQETPAAMALELWKIGRALREAGMRVQRKSGSFLTVRFRAPDGAVASVDVYTTFYLDGLLYETATVRAPVPLSAVLPLSEIEFEGRMFPAPADPAAMLEVSYGPGWAVPDPSFKHTPGPEITDRFDDWFGTLMPGKRDWTRYHQESPGQPGPPSEFARWVGDRLEPGARVVDVGAGGGADVFHYASTGRVAIGLDYALPPRVRRKTPKGTRFRSVNLLDLRDVLTTGAMLARQRGPRAVVAHELMEALDPAGLEGFWALVRMLVRQGGQLFMSGVARSPRDAAAHTAAEGTGRLRAFAPHRLEEQVRELGGTVTEASGFDAARQAVRGGAPARWILVARWPSRGVSRAEVENRG